MRNSRFLGFFDDLSLGLCCRRHERNQGVANSLPHWVGSRAVESHTVDHRLDPDLSPDEFAHRVCNVLVVTSEAINPPHQQGVTFTKNVEQTPSFRSLAQAGGYPGHAVVRQYEIKFKP